MPQQGAPFLCYAVGNLSATVRRNTSEAITFQTMSGGMTLLYGDLLRLQLHAEAASHQSLSLLLPTQPPEGTEKIKMMNEQSMSYKDVRD